VIRGAPPPTMALDGPSCSLRCAAAARAGVCSASSGQTGTAHRRARGRVTRADALRSRYGYFPLEMFFNASRLLSSLSSPACSFT
jgi:hypothetical protein